MNERLFTHDLELCAHSFTHKRPEKINEVTFWLSQSQKPMDSVAELSSALERVSEWLIPAAKSWLEINP